MNTLNPSRPKVRQLALLSLAAILASGCATVERPLSADSPHAWASRMHTLPVDVHGAVPGETVEQTAADIDHGMTQQAHADFRGTGVSISSTPRVVVYIGSPAPARDQYCELDPNTNQAAFIPRSGMVVRSELCDGSRPVAYARLTLAESDPSPAIMADAVKQLKLDLVKSLQSADTLPSVYSN